MCGVAGIFRLGANFNPVRKDEIIRMLSVISYRGPDESGIYTGNNISLGNVRLSIIDLKTGRQPISDESGNYWIVYNGEVFNYVELRKELEESGRKFKTSSDTEVVVQLYAEYKEKCLEKLNGQFAFAIWNKKERELFLARDRVGICPLYYNFNGYEFTFGSEIKAILQNPAVKPSINFRSLKQIFTFWTTISPETIFNDIFEVPPGHYMKISPDRNVKIIKYWSVDFSKTSRFNLKDASEQLFTVLKDATRLRLRADVPVAAYLSGGLDSTFTTFLVKSIEPDILNTFSIGFDNKDFDESIYQFEASKYLDTVHKSFQCSANDILNVFQNIIWHTEIPVLRTAPAPLYLLSRLVRDSGIKVVITGEGADEILGGYDIFKEAKIRSFWANQPSSQFRPSLLKYLYNYIPYLQSANLQMLKFFFGYHLEDIKNPFYSHLIRWHNNSHLINYFHQEIINQTKDYSPLEELSKNLPENFDNWTLLTRAQYLEITLFMSGYLLSTQGDRMAMANSVEGRYPFLDHRVIELATSFPDRFKLMGLDEKFILKKIAANRIPDSIVKRPKKAYRAPITEVFLPGNQSSYVDEMLSKKNIDTNGIFNYSQVEKLIYRIKTLGQKSEINDMALAGIISTQLLYDIFIKNRDLMNKPIDSKITPLIINESEMQ
jgi:asparagine synthase (glutamine-hydrolysing)